MVLYMLFLCLVFATAGRADKPCAARHIPGQSVVCVCNSTYCDEVTRDAPAPGKYVAYTSSESGFRFNKVFGELQADNDRAGSCTTSLTLNPGKTFQSIEGFGGAVTDAAGINWKNLSDASLEQKLIDSYYSENGIQYNMVRVPIGGSDFSTRPYAYNELPTNDATLSNFSLAYEDYEYKIPMINAISAASAVPVHIVATTWSPPPWMKTNEKFSGYSRLKPQYYQTYADYHFKFLEKYASEGIFIWGITTTNEPMNGVFNIAPFNTLGWTPENMGLWIEKFLGPTIRNSTFKYLKILTHDDQRVSIPFWFNLMVKEHPKALDYIDGVAVHFYTDQFVPASMLSLISKAYPDKFILATEACEGAAPWLKDKVLLGSWERAKNYIVDIMGDLNNNVVGWIDWNMCLNAQGGPNWVSNFVDSPIIVFPKNKEFIKQPMFYGLGHFSKFLPRGSRRIEATEKKPFWKSSVEHVAFLTPQPLNTVVVVLYNYGGQREVCLKLNKKSATVSLAAKSVVTIEMPYEG